MKKSELKNIIKECIREVIFEEGVLSNIVTEVATGMRASNTSVVREAVTPQVNSQMQDLADRDWETLSSYYSVPMISVS